MAIAFDATTTGGATTGTSLTYSHTTGTDNNRILFVAVRGGGGEGDRVSGVTYAGQSLTKIGTATEPGDLIVVTLWYLVAPATGANNVVVSLSSSGFVASDCATYSGAAQSGVPDNSGTKTQLDNASVSFNLQPVVDQSWIAISVSDRVIPTAITGVTKRQNQLFDSGAAVSNSGAHTMSIGGGDAGTDWGVVYASFAPASEVSQTVTDIQGYFLI